MSRNSMHQKNLEYLAGKTSSELIQIYDIRGDLIYEGEHRSIKQAVETAVKEGVNLSRADLRNAKLSHIILKGVNLFLAKLEGADLLGANLEGANLEKANLQKANLKGANLYRANLREATLWKANLEATELGSADLSSADLSKANLDKANLKQARMFNANVMGASLQRAYLDRANLEGSNLEGSNLWDASLEGADLQKANLRGSNLKGANLKGANLKGADLDGAKGLDDSYTSSLVQENDVIDDLEELHDIDIMNEGEEEVTAFTDRKGNVAFDFAYKDLRKDPEGMMNLLKTIISQLSRKGANVFEWGPYSDEKVFYMFIAPNSLKNEKGVQKALDSIIKREGLKDLIMYDSDFDGMMGLVAKG